MPELNPSSAEPNHRQPLRSAAPLLKRYSVLMKIVTRDASLRQEHQHEIESVLRDVERWIAEAKTAVDISSGNLGWEGVELDDSTVNFSAQAVKERLALEALCESLAEEGALVPLAKKCVLVRARCEELRTDAVISLSRKRTLDAASFHPRREAVLLWMPLINHIESLHAGFITILIAQLALHVLNGPAAPGPGTLSARDGSHDSFLAAWTVYLLDGQTLSMGGGEDANRGLTTKANIIPVVMGGLGPQGVSTLSERKT